MGQDDVRSVLRRARPLGPLVARLLVLLALAWAAGLPSSWSPVRAGPAVPGVQAHGADPAVGVNQADGTPTPMATLDPTLYPLSETPTPTATLALPDRITSPAASPSPYTGVDDPCWGDEQITFVPDVPRAGNELLIAVTSARPHPYGRVAGTERTTFVRERTGQLGYVWEWTIQLTWPGKHEYTFFVDSTIPCKKIEIQVRQNNWTKTPTPTKTPDPDNDNGD
jgi:hypothetical protein